MITGIIRESIERSINIQENLGVEAKGFMESLETAGFDEGMLEESILPSFRKLFSKGLDRYRFMFLEKGEERFIFTKVNNEFQAFQFVGKERWESIRFGNDQEMQDFIDDKKSKGFKVVNRDGKIAQFFKKIVRMVGKHIVSAGITNSAIALVVLLGIIAIGVDFSSVLPASINISGLVGAAAGFNMATASSGWMLTKWAKEKGSDANYATLGI